MLEFAVLILALYIVFSIFQRSMNRSRQLLRLQMRVAELTSMVASFRDSDASQQEISERIIEMELRDLRTQLAEFSSPADKVAQQAFEQSHFVDGPVSKSVVVAPTMPTEAESTL